MSGSTPVQAKPELGGRHNERSYGGDNVSTNERGL